MTFKSILCPVDFSEESRNALRFAAAFAVKFQGSVTVLNVVEPLLEHAARVRYGLDLPKGETEPALRTFVAETFSAASWLPGMAIEVRVGDAPAVILETAERQRHDLLVLGTRGLGGFRKLILGSTTERVLREARVPVIAVPGGGVSVALEASGPRFTIKSILAATDFSQTASDAVRLAAGFAQSLDVTLLITHVVSPVVVPSQWQPYVDPADDERVRDAREQLDVWLRALGVQGEVVIGVGRPADSIAATAAKEGAGLIAMGLFGERRRFAPRPGSIAYRVLSDTQVPVMVIPPQASGDEVPSRASG